MKISEKNWYDLNDQNFKKYFYGFIDTISNLELMNHLTENQFSDFLKNKLIIQDSIPNFINDNTFIHRESLQNYHNVITSFEQFKSFITSSEDLTDIQKNEFGTQKSIDYFKKLKKDKLDTLVEFNGINELFFKENFILLSAMNKHEHIVDIKFNQSKRELNVKTFGFEKQDVNSIDWENIVNKKEKWSIEYSKTKEIVPEPTNWWHEQIPVLTVLNKNSLEIRLGPFYIEGVFNFENISIFRKYFS
ncbi:hypothetical protein EI74_0051 [Mycoplasma testudineum]|uniref:Uncharacterized protein n=1 Tax=Mycoplasma testudineum TaxID=244584 RepID=A0A4R6IJJ5_9MOLU|nr:hypothetical protein [Mycoplasma testudineum]OYD26431.1 hypothetical protein CG473_04055 [Mycoplasma testudineum]TDO22106.1 hypothetical protein EI74_0051 [Mycoplasma testudineum]